MAVKDGEGPGLGGRGRAQGRGEYGDSFDPLAWPCCWCSVSYPLAPAGIDL